MTQDEFMSEVWKRLPVIAPSEVQFVIRAVEEKFERKWTVHETSAWCRCLEHVDPDLDEDVALRGMKRIEDNVKLRLGNGKV